MGPKSGDTNAGMSCASPAPLLLGGNAPCACEDMTRLDIENKRRAQTSIGTVVLSALLEDVASDFITHGWTVGRLYDRIPDTYAGCGVYIIALRFDLVWRLQHTT